MKVNVHYSLLIFSGQNNSEISTKFALGFCHVYFSNSCQPLRDSLFMVNCQNGVWPVLFPFSSFSAKNLNLLGFPIVFSYG